MSTHDELEPYRAEFTAFCEHMEVGLKTRFPSLTQKEVLAVICISLFAETQKIQRDNAALENEVSGLRSARIAYASEFASNADGEPDVGNIHANIRAVKRDAARYRWLRRQAISARYYASGNPNWEIDWALRGESFEAAVDAAMKTTET